jgi:hypothetical protein
VKLSSRIITSEQEGFCIFRLPDLKFPNPNQPMPPIDFSKCEPPQFDPVPWLIALVMTAAVIFAFAQ